MITSFVLYVCGRALLEKLDVADDMKMADWLDQRVGMLEQRDTAMLHRLLHDIEKTRRVNHCHKNVLWMKSLQWCVCMVFTYDKSISRGRSGRLRKIAEN
jgi:hypothetical protein